MKHNDPIYIGDNAIDELLAYVAANRLTQFTLVADENTYAALGERVAQALNEKGYDLTKIVLTGEEVIADEAYIVEVLRKAPKTDHTFIAVGGGTVTDITRFVSYNTRNPFISVPTSPSVDGFNSIGAPVVLRGVKTTIICQPPLACFIDMPTLQAAPSRLRASGFGDIIGKITSLADWQIGRLLWDESYDEAIAARAQVGLDTCMRYAEQIRRGDADGIRHLMDGLVESALCMVEFGSSRPASGAEHHASHYWEMMLMNAGRPAILHGAKVGFATIQVVQLYEHIRNMSRQDIMTVVEGATLPERAAEEQVIREAYGAVAEDVIEAQADFLNMTAADFDQLKQRILDRWENIQAIAAAVPTSETVAAYLREVAAPTTPDELGLSEQEVVDGMRYGHYLRNRFTSRKLFHMLGMDHLIE